MSWCYRIKTKYIRLYELFTGNCSDKERQQSQWTEILLIQFQANRHKMYITVKGNTEAMINSTKSLIAICCSQYRLPPPACLTNCNWTPSLHHSTVKQCLTPRETIFLSRIHSLHLSIAFGLFSTASPQTLH